MHRSMNTRIFRTILIAATCGVIGAGAGIAGAGAHDTHAKGKTRTANHGKHHAFGHDKFFFGAPVHAEAVVPDRQGSFKTITFDRGTVKSVSGDQLTITEGTPTAVYKDVTLTIPADAKVKRDGDDAQLSALQAGDLVAVVTSGDKTVVRARSADQQNKHD